jgi:hypothetical protein
MKELERPLFAFSPRITTYIVVVLGNKTIQKEGFGKEM